MSKENILLTGASGFIGGHTFNKLEAAGHEVFPFTGDISNPSDWQKNLVGGEIIFLIAGVRTETDLDFEVNAKAIEKLFDTIDREQKLPKKVVLASSQAVYMGNKVPFTEPQEPHPTTTYGRSKLLGENIAKVRCEELGIPLAILRYSTVLGSGVRENSKMSGPLFIWTKLALSGEPLKVNQDGNQTRDYIHVEDVVNANILSINIPSGTYNISGDRPIRLSELANWVCQAAQSDSQVIILGGEPSYSDPHSMVSDTSKIRSQGWETAKTAKQAVEEFVRQRMA